MRTALASAIKQAVSTAVAKLTTPTLEDKRSGKGSKGKKGKAKKDKLAKKGKKDKPKKAR